MEFLRESEELRTAFHDAPAHLDAHGIHEQRQRRQDLGHSPAVLCRADVDDAEILQLRSLGDNPVNRLVTYKRPVFLDRVQPEGGRFNSFLHCRAESQTDYHQTAFFPFRSREPDAEGPCSQLRTWELRTLAPAEGHASLLLSLGGTLPTRRACRGLALLAMHEVQGSERSMHYLLRLVPHARECCSRAV